MLGESQNIEYKESWNDKYLQWICGFANAQGGRVYIGVNDDKENYDTVYHNLHSLHCIASACVAFQPSPFSDKAKTRV